MKRTLRTPLVRLAALAALGLPLADPAAAQGGPNPGVDREQMWPAPTAEDWKRPCLVEFQRTFEDAVKVARETGRQLLVCVNMDGEIASEHYAGVRYRDPAIAKIYEPYVCVIASVYRHNPRDYDEEGRRILCPRFGSVTCGEHIAIEPGLFDRFFEGKRVAPRHIGVELDGAETYDVYYAWDTASVFEAIRSHSRPAGPDPRGDRPLLQRVDSADNEDLTAVEDAYARGDREQRRALLQAALRRPGGAPVDLLRLAVFGLDADLARLARSALCDADSEGAIDLILEALRVPMDGAERDCLVAALERIGETSPRARALAAVHRGLAGGATALDAERWTRALARGAEAEPRGAVESRLDELERGVLARSDYDRGAARGPDAATELGRAEAFLELALQPGTSGRFAGLLDQDALRAARSAEELGASGFRLDAVLAVAAQRAGDFDEARARAERAVRALPPPSDEALAPDAASGRIGAAVLELFARARQRTVWRAVREKREWPPEWLADVDTAYGILARHPLGTDAHAAEHTDFLRMMGAFGRAAEVLDRGLERFPDSWLLHERLRGRILAEKGAAGLEPEYAAMLARPGAARDLAWYAGYASLVAAEYHRRAGADAAALASYERGIAHYDAAARANPESAETCDHYAALALAGQARLALEGGDLERSLALVLASFARRPQAAATLDGLNLSPVDTAKMLRARLVEAGRREEVERLEGALAELPPELLELPAYERAVPDAGRGGRDGARGR